MVETIHHATLSVQIDRLFARAAEVLHQHRSNDGRCAVCGTAFPCSLAVLAEHNLAF
jgi:hypothetical protein